MERLLTVKDVVSRTGLAERTVRLAIHDGRLRAIRLIGLRRAVRIPESALAEFLGVGARPPSGAPGVGKGRARALM